MVMENLKELITYIGIISSIIVFAKDIYGIRSKLLKIPLIRRIWWWIINKKIILKISSIKSYPNFTPNLNRLEREINNYIIHKLAKKISYSSKGKNYLQILPEGLNAPLIIEFSKDIGLDEDLEKGEVITGINVQIKVLGLLTFTYREGKNFEKLLGLIEKIFEIIEKIHGISPLYENYSLQATGSEFEENWSSKKEIVEEDYEVKIGSKIIMLNSKKIHPLYTFFSSYLLRLPN